MNYAARWRQRGLAGDAGRAGGFHRSMAKGAVEAQQRRPHRQAGRTESLARTRAAIRRPSKPFASKCPPTGRTRRSLYLVATDLGDGNDHDFVVWQEPKFVASGRPALLFKDVRQASRELSVLRADLFAETAKYLTGSGRGGQARWQDRWRGAGPKAFARHRSPASLAGPAGCGERGTSQSGGTFQKQNHEQRRFSIHSRLGHGGRRPMSLPTPPTSTFASPAT